MRITTNVANKNIKYVDKFLKWEYNIIIIK